MSSHLNIKIAKTDIIQFQMKKIIPYIKNIKNMQILLMIFIMVGA